MEFVISKPTLRDIPAMRNLILPEVQRGIILDRSEDEMASAIRSYSVVRVSNSSLESRNSFSGNHSADSLDLERSQTASLVSRPKSSENYESTTAIPSVVDSANLESKINSSLRVSEANAAIHNKNIDCHDFASSNLAMTANIADSANRAKNAESNPQNTHPLAPSAREGGFLDSNHAREGGKIDSISAREGGQNTANAPIIAFAALQILSPTLAEIRSLIVGESYRRMGLATHLINHILGEARALNLKEVLALTYQKEVFAKIGFVEIAKDSLPNQKIWADCIKCKKFPICDEIALLKTL